MVSPESASVEAAVMPTRVPAVAPSRTVSAVLVFVSAGAETVYSTLDTATETAATDLLPSVDVARI